MHSEELKKTDSKEGEMNRHLARIDRALNSPWRAFIRGTFQGLGSIIGATIVIVFIGWFLNVVGVIPEFKEYVEEFRVMVQDIRNVR